MQITHYELNKWEPIPVAFVLIYVAKKFLARVKATPHLRLQNWFHIALQDSLIWLAIA